MTGEGTFFYALSYRFIYDILPRKKLIEKRLKKITEMKR